MIFAGFLASGCEQTLVCRWNWHKEAGYKRKGGIFNWIDIC